ncbi:pantoate--beta-alanine ligase [Paenibacillus rhizovicinus]|uniref:Pantothenate synthetase n=1 Tax=Paenibacillus rhizovicinus TaxID=2704463 RepID=A0A6C0NWR5_9BACL|nr:pantoate--beta-alanine ligase [Paenibacillus rhizovicinus]QHW30153.1 pantoate--beta-alanine ligase [Paenibacillus rhizovicinus]
MIICTTIVELKAALARQRSKSPNGFVGLVPTMGYLHEGHASLMQRAGSECEFTVVSVFVNPLQFGPNEDFDKYPRDLERDAALAEKNGVALLFVPSVKEMYPTKPLTRVLISEVTDSLCGASRPGHFDGVGTVVSKLFNLVQPDRAYFGMKDAQQVAVVQQMVHDLNMPVDIIPCETVREPDGLAMSSRNVYLEPGQRKQALILSRTLNQAGELLHKPDMTAGKLLDAAKATIQSAPLAIIDYVELLHYPSLQPIEPDRRLAELNDKLILALAVKFGGTRLIDNRLFQTAGGEPHVQNNDEIQAAPSYSN